MIARRLIAEPCHQDDEQKGVVHTVKTRFWGKLFPRLLQGADA